MFRLLTALAVALFASAGRAQAHPAPFSYIDLRLPGDATEPTLEAAVVAHVFDVAHELGVEPVERLLEPTFLASKADAIRELFRSRLAISSDRRALTEGRWLDPEPLAERQSIRLRVRFGVVESPGIVTISTTLFPYDLQHQTFLNFYERNEIAAQAILDRGRTTFDYFAGTRQGALAVVRKFLPSGIHHILIGPDHLLFLVGLLLLGGTLRQLALVVTAFTLAHSVTLSLAALGIYSPPAHLVEPAIALSIVYVGADNLMVRGGRDMRGWIAFGFGLIHGFGFANVLRAMDLPSRALGWSLFSFNLGVELGQLAVVAALATAVAALRARSELAGRRVAVVGSIVVIAAGVYWFIQRVFFPGGMA
jgi:hydrogenase/urease accessory protein HupE